MPGITQQLSYLKMSPSYVGNRHHDNLQLKNNAKYDTHGCNKLSIVPFYKDFSPSGEQIEHRKLAHEL